MCSLLDLFQIENKYSREQMVQSLKLRSAGVSLGYVYLQFIRLLYTAMLNHPGHILLMWWSSIHSFAWMKDDGEGHSWSRDSVFQNESGADIT